MNENLRYVRTATGERERERVDGDGSGHFSPSLSPSPSSSLRAALFLSAMDRRTERRERGNE